MSEATDQKTAKSGKKSDMIKTIAQNSNVSPQVVKTVIEQIGKMVPEYLEKEDLLGIPKLGKFRKISAKESGRQVIRFQPHTGGTKETKKAS